jgi:hypothetical protein
MDSNKHLVLGMHDYVESCRHWVSNHQRQILLFFYYNRGNYTMFVLVYVDDIIVASSSQEATNALLKDLEKEFALKDLGICTTSLGLRLKETWMDWCCLKGSTLRILSKEQARVIGRRSILRCLA